MNLQIYKTGGEAGQGHDASGGGTHVDHEFIVPQGGKTFRLDVFLSGALRKNGHSREKIKQAIAAGRICINGDVCLKPNTPVTGGDSITIRLPSPVATLEAEQGELEILWHDDCLAVLNKPAGLTVHPAPGRPDGTLANRLLHRFPELAAQGGLRPGIVHRLDKDTSGLMLAALTEKSRLAMSAAFSERSVNKEYLALVRGVPRPTRGAITKPIGRHPSNKTKMAVVPLEKGGKEAHSEYETLYSCPTGSFSLVRVAIHTGRTHQIRVHMLDAGHPLLGDALYAAKNDRIPKNAAPRQMLHAHRLSFTHPETGERLSFCAEPPEDFTTSALTLARTMQRLILTGSPGGGKSSLTRLLHRAGVPVWSADEAVKRLYEPGGDGWYLLRSRFEDRFVPDGNAGVDKKALFAAMIESDAFRREVEAMIHPLARHSLDAFWREREAAGEPLAAAEIPLFLESGWRGKKRPEGKDESKEVLVTVYTPLAERRKRMAAGRGWSNKTIAVMESWQWPEEKKVRWADLVVDNSGSEKDLERRAEQLLKALTFLRQQDEKRLGKRLAAFWAC